MGGVVADFPFGRLFLVGLSLLSIVDSLMAKYGTGGASSKKRAKSGTKKSAAHEMTDEEFERMQTEMGISKKAKNNRTLTNMCNITFSDFHLLYIAKIFSLDIPRRSYDGISYFFFPGYVTLTKDFVLNMLQQQKMMKRFLQVGHLILNL